ncbi:hypothetical protein [Halobacteriovorax sp.]|uniref:hypothetical protein n=1 Tax=Halobacteriovorax sp. TaxID=2020862 RepID=UPI00356AA589
MKKTIIRLGLSGIALLFLSITASARMSGDVKTTLLDVESEFGKYHYEIHLPKSEKNYLNRIIEILKNDTAKLAGYFKYAPSSAVHLSYVEDAQNANGSATVFPANIINLRKYPPLGSNHLSSSSNFLRELLLHELIHIIHMDQTRGIVKGVRTVFGSFGKLGGVVPRWFAEGIATWGESTFTNGGRLRNELLEAEWESVFKSKDFCKTIDCLDEPGKFPYGQYAYWTGAYFMEHLENIRPGAVQCLVFANSNNIPFFLNDAFKECFGSSAISMYKDFREKVLSDLKSRKEEDSKLITPLKSILGFKSFQEGMTLIKGKLLTVEVKDRQQRILEQDLKSGSHKEVHYSDKLASIEKLNNSSLSINTFSNIRSTTKRESAIYDLNSISKKKRRGDYNFLFENEEVSLTYNQLNWVINGGEFTFPEEVSITSLRPVETGIFFKLFDERRNKSFAYFYDVKEKTVREGFEVLENFEILDSCSEGVIARESGKLSYITSRSRTSLNLPFGKRIVAAALGENKSAIVLKGSKSTLYQMNVGCLNLDDYYGSSKKISFNKVDLSRFDSLNSFDEKEVSYPRMAHFIPTHWMLNYTQATDALSYWSALTTLSDPDQRHSLALKGVFYTGISEVTPEIDYRYEFPNDFYLSLSHSKEYTSSSQRQEYDSTKQNYASLSHLLELEDIDLISTLYVGHIDVDDFISNRSEKEFGGVLRLSLIPTRVDDFIASSSLRLRVFKKEVEGSRNYNGLQSILKTETHPFRDFYLGLDLAYSSLDKRNFNSGVVYAGGSYTEYHQFYGIAYSDIFGNEVKTMRAKLRYELLDIYRGAGLIPIFVKELHLLAGTDLVGADRVLVGNRYLRNSSAQSYWAGISSEFTIAYAVPVTIDLIRSRVVNRYGKDIDSTTSVIKGGFSF